MGLMVGSTQRKLDPIDFMNLELVCKGMVESQGINHSIQNKRSDRDSQLALLVQGALRFQNLFDTLECPYGKEQWILKLEKGRSLPL